MIKTCQLCSTEFNADRRKRKFCSRKCSDAYLLPSRMHQFDGKRGINPPRQEQRPNWKGDEASANTKRHRARNYHTLREFCDRCLVAKAKDRHHIDGDPGNNDESNIAHLCRRCHMLIDGRLGQRKGKGKLQVNVKELAAQLEGR